VGRLCLHIDWNHDRVVEAIKSAVACPDNPAGADAFKQAIARQRASELSAARRIQKEEAEAAKHRRCEAEMDGLKADLAALVDQDPGMSLLDAVEFITPDPGDRLALYRSVRIPSLKPEQTGFPSVVPRSRVSSVC
jgi:hypothetical protein